MFKHDLNTDSEKFLATFRWVGIAAILVWALIPGNDAVYHFNKVLMFILLGATILSTFLFDMAVRRLSTNSKYAVFFSRLGIAFDVVAVAVFVGLASPKTNPIFFLNYLVVIHAAVYWRIKGSIATSVIITAVYLTETFLNPATAFPVENTFFIMKIGFLFLIGIMGGGIVGFELRQREFNAKIIADLEQASERLKSVSGNVFDFNESMAEELKIVRSSISEILVAMEQLSGETEGQRDNLGSLTGELKNMRTFTEKVGESISNVNNDITSIMGRLSNGKHMTMDISTQMQKIVTKVMNTRDSITTLSEGTNSIAQAAEMIKTISDQTNLLSLNAAIEAARAGESGKGFAVVAEEIRKLANETKNMSSQITATISVINSNWQNARETVNNEVEEVNNGINMIDQTIMLFNDVVSSIESLSQSIRGANGIIQDSSVEITDKISFIDGIVTNVYNVVAATSMEARRLLENIRKQNETINNSIHSISQLSTLAQEIKD